MIYCFGVVSFTSILIFLSLFSNNRDLWIPKIRMSTRTRFSQYLVVRTREPASFWRENVIGSVILLQAETS